MKTTQDALKIQFDVVRCWTDSTIVLGYLSEKKKLKVFEHNRVLSILPTIPYEKWGHTSTKDNPADPASRAIYASELLNHSLWLKGPPWLSTVQFSSDPVVMMVTPDEPSPVSNFINNCSSFTKIKHTVAYWRRFLHNCRAKLEVRKEFQSNSIRCTPNFISGDLSVKEISFALNAIIRIIQAEEFPKELAQVNKRLTVKSNMKFLTPFLDSNGILRVGGRLQQSNLSYDQRHPILLPKHHNFTIQVVKYYHLTYLHAGPQLLLARLRDQYWIIGGPIVVRNCVTRCVLCFRQNPATTTQLMGQLPAFRVTPARAFIRTGVDYAGPFFLCIRAGRNPKIIKSYVSLFICMRTRAIHLEFVSDLSTPAFVGALTRFISRRGLPSDIYCDGGKNFVGAKNEMTILQKFLTSHVYQQKLNSFFVDRFIKYHINPPLSPHHGGLWETGIKSMKHNLRRTVEDRRLSIEEFLTLLAQVEAGLNSRPLTPMSSDPNDFNFLTPGHFLIGDNLSALPQHDVTHFKTNQLTRWKLVQQMFQHFWQRWSSEYLTRLQSRPKWFSPQPNLKIGDLVLIRDDEPLLVKMETWTNPPSFPWTGRKDPSL